MRVIVVGVSKVGESLVKYIIKDGADVVVVDENAARINKITDDYDCNGIVGNGMSVDVLKKAGIDTTSVLIAVTKSDETNAVIASIAKILGVKKTIAAIRNSAFKSSHSFFKKEMGIDVIVNPERLAATEVCRMIRYPEGVRVEQFGNLNVRIASLKVAAGSIFDNTKLMDIRNKTEYPILVTSLERKKKVFVPNGDTVIKEGDNITVLALGDVLDKFLTSIGMLEKVINKVLVIGASKTGIYIAEQLQNAGVKVKFMEMDQEKCAELLEKYPKVHVVCADALDTVVLKKELSGMDACVSTIGNDEQNLIVSMFAKSFGVDRISAEIDNLNYAKMIKESGLSHIFSTQEVSVAGVLRNARSVANSIDDSSNNSIKWLLTFSDGRVEAAEFVVKENFKLAGLKLADPEFKLKNNTLIATVIKDGEAFVAGGNTEINVGDKIIVVCTDYELTDINDIIA